MRLTEVLLRFKKKPPGGHMWRGKYRLFKEVLPIHVAKVRREFEMEEKNMFYLRHPYLTIEQSHGHAQALGKHKQFIEKCRQTQDKWKEHVYLGDRIGFLKVSDKWE